MRLSWRKRLRKWPLWGELLRRWPAPSAALPRLARTPPTWLLGRFVRFPIPRILRNPLRVPIITQVVQPVPHGIALLSLPSGLLFLPTGSLYWYLYPTCSETARASGQLTARLRLQAAYNFSGAFAGGAHLPSVPSAGFSIRNWLLTRLLAACTNNAGACRWVIVVPIGSTGHLFLHPAMTDNLL